MTLPLLGPLSLVGLRTSVGLPLPVGRPGADRCLRRRADGPAETDAAVRQHGAAGERRAQAAHQDTAPARDPAGPVARAVHHRDGRTDQRRPDSTQPRGGDAGHRRLAVDARHRRSAEPVGSSPGRGQAVRRRTHPWHQSGPDRVRGHRNGIGCADDQSPGREGGHRQAAVGGPHGDRRGHLHRTAGDRHRGRGDRRRRRTAPSPDRAAVRRQGDRAVESGQSRRAPTRLRARRRTRAFPSRPSRSVPRTATSRSTTNVNPCRSTTRR